MLYTIFMISAIVLSAGLSKRFGSPKALTYINNTTSIEHIQVQLLNSSVDEIIIIIGHDAERIKKHVLQHPKIIIAYNKDYSLGQTSSVQCGIKQCHQHSDGIFIWPVDCPLIQTSTIELLIKAHHDNPTKILIPTYQGKKGHPPLFPSVYKSKLMQLTVDQGINVLFSNDDVLLISTDDAGVLKTFNTPEEYKNVLDS